MLRADGRLISAFPQKRKCQCAAAKRRFVPKATECVAAKVALLDHLVGTHEQSGWHSKAKRLGSLEVDHKLELRDSLAGAGS